MRNISLNYHRNCWRVAKHKEITGQDLADASSKHTSYQAVTCRLKQLINLGLVQKKPHLGKRGYLYFLNPPLTKKIIDESLLGIIPDSSEEDDEITSEDNPLSSPEVARLMAKEQFFDEEVAPTNEDARVHQLFDNNHESLDVNTTEQKANGYSQSGTFDRQPLVSLDSPPNNAPDLDTAYDIEDEIELLYGVIKAQQSEIESSKAEIESLKQRMAAIEELMGQSNQKRDSDRTTQLQAQNKIDRRSQRMQSIKSFASASISLPSDQMINSNGKG